MATTTDRPQALRLLVGIVVVAIVLGRLPGPLGGWVAAIGTAAHEAGHAAVADVLTGDVVSLTVFPAGGGVTITEASDSGWRSFLVSAAGYPATLLAALVLLTSVLLARSSRPVAAAGAVACGVALLFWTPFGSAVDGISDGDQRFTWFVLLVTGGALAGAAALPDRHDAPRRIVLGAVAVGLLTDAFRAGKDLATIEDRASATRTDADGLADAAGFLSSGVWAFLLRGSLFVVLGLWSWWIVRRWQPPDVESGTRL